MSARSPDGRAGPAVALDDPDHARLADPPMHLDTPALELRGHDAGCPDLLEPEFRMRVEIAPDGGQVVGIGEDAGDGFHAGLSRSTASTVDQVAMVVERCQRLVIPMGSTRGPASPLAGRRRATCQRDRMRSAQRRGPSSVTASPCHLLPQGEKERAPRGSCRSPCAYASSSPRPDRPESCHPGAGRRAASLVCNFIRRPPGIPRGSPRVGVRRGVGADGLLPELPQARPPDLLPTRCTRASRPRAEPSGRAPPAVCVPEPWRATCIGVSGCEALRPPGRTRTPRRTPTEPRRATGSPDPAHPDRTPPPIRPVIRRPPDGGATGM